MIELAEVDKPLKVLHLIDSGGLYGAEKMLLALVAEQIKQGLEPIILSAGELYQVDKPLEIEAKKLGLPLKIWRMKPGLNLKESWKIIAWAKIEGVDLLHSHGYKFNLLMGAFPSSIRKLPLLTTVHGYVKAKKFSKMWLYEWLDQRALSRMAKVCVVSKPMLAMSFAQKIEQSKLVYIANGIAEIRQPQILNDNIKSFKNNFDVCIAAIGRLSPEKGFADLIEAMAQLFSSQVKLKQNLCLVIIGEGPLKEGLQEKIEALGLSENVLLAGYQDGAGDTLVDFNVLVMPSKTEGLPITLLEAMSSSCPVIASRVGGIPSVLNESNASLFDANSIDQLLKAISNFIAEPELAEDKARKAKQHFLQNYTASVMALQYRDVYSEVVNHQGLG